jgi:methyl-accepting chemotaxis protein
MNEQGIFVKLERHDEVQRLIQEIRQKTKEAREKLDRIKGLDNLEARKIDEFEQMADSINANLDKVQGLIR